jgi:hypothetical protein
MRDGDPFIDETLDGLRSSQRAILAGIPDWVLERNALTLPRRPDPMVETIVRVGINELVQELGEVLSVLARHVHSAAWPATWNRYPTIMSTSSTAPSPSCSQRRGNYEARHR